MKASKIVAGLAAVTMLAAISAQAVFAADSVSIKAGDVKVKAGEEFKIEISLDGVPAAGVNEIEFAVTYDSKAITISGVTPGAVASTGVEAAENLEGVKGFEAGYDTAGVVTISYSTGLGDAKYAMGDGVFAIISGKVDASAKGEYPIKVTGIPRETVEGKGDTNTEVKAGLLDADGKVTKYAAKGVAGTLTVTTGEQEETPTSGTETGKVTYCDVNLDGDIDIMDVITFNKYILGIIKLSDEAKANADVDANGVIDTTDVLNVLKRVVGKLEDSAFPIKS